MDDALLVRHAIAGSNRDGVASCTAPGAGLTDEGREQAIALRASLAGLPIELGVATDFARTQETLELGLDGRDIPRVLIPSLNEIHFGNFDGGALDVYRGWAAAELPSTLAPGGGESRATAAARFAGGVRELLARPERLVVVVSHALVIRYVLDASQGLVPAARMAPVAHATPFPASRAELERAATLLEEWSRAPAFRDPSIEG